MTHSLIILTLQRFKLKCVSYNPRVTNLAADFIDDIDRRNEFKRQAKNGKGDRYKPLLYIASDFDDEKQRLAELIHLRLSNNETIGILFPQKRFVHGYAKGLKELGIEVDVDSHNGLNFSNGHPKVLTYHEAKGLTFDCIFMPRLDTLAFTDKISERLKSLMFVGVSRAVSWVYLSGIDGKLIDIVSNLCDESSKDYLEVQRKSITNTSNSNQAEILDENFLDDFL